MKNMHESIINLYHSETTKHVYIENARESARRSETTTWRIPSGREYKTTRRRVCADVYARKPCANLKCKSSGIAATPGIKNVHYIGLGIFFR